MTYNELYEQIKAKKSFLCVGLDSDPTLFPECLKVVENPIFEFNKALRQERANARTLFDTDLCKAAMEEYNVNGAQFNALYAYVLENCTEHSYICVNLIDDVEDIIDFFSTVVDMR